MNFSDCQQTVRDINSKFPSNSTVIVNTNTILMLKVRTIDKDILLTCSAADKQLTTTLTQH
jgi:hypothetical protein